MFAVLCLLLSSVSADMYMHMPRGSNNRLNEAAATRNNGNRLFDSQNNNRGGYNVCEMGTSNNDFSNDDYMATPQEMYDFRWVNTGTPFGGEGSKQYEEIYFEQSRLTATWTNQHGTGNKKLNSHIILQFICDTVNRANSAGANGFGPNGNSGNLASTYGLLSSADLQTRVRNLRSMGLRVELYNGGNTNTPDEPDEIQDDADGNVVNTYQNNQANERGRRESEEWYTLCKSRSQNYGLFHADQNLQGDSQKYTRQNPGGTRRGLECPEERDYYPYWNPTPFHDVAIITPDMEYCTNVQLDQSQNNNVVSGCFRDISAATDNPGTYLPQAAFVEHNLNQTSCEANGGEWRGLSWNSNPPECVDSYWTKVNYLGNVDGSARGGEQARYLWDIPEYNDLVVNHQCYPYSYSLASAADYVAENAGQSNSDTATINCVRMMFRARYNMSTMDYDPYKTNSSMDEDDNEGIISPIEQNPQVEAGVYAQGLQLAINTAQTGRTFQDNSHTFLVCEKTNTDFDTNSIINYNVRGKRGNIVQTFPATEYDFEPQHLFIRPGECMHFQWCGSNTHNNNNPAGDGQAGDAGEGEGGTDRHNFCQMVDVLESFPKPYHADAGVLGVTDFFDTFVTCHHPLFPGIDVTAADARIILGTGGYYRGTADAAARIGTNDNNNTPSSDDDNNNYKIQQLLNNVSAAFRQGLVCCVNNDATVNTAINNFISANPVESGITFPFMCTRNNNFSNRSQKSKIVVGNTLSTVTGTNNNF